MHTLFSVCVGDEDCLPRDLVTHPISPGMEQTQGAETQRCAETQFEVHSEPTDPTMQVSTLPKDARVNL